MNDINYKNTNSPNLQSISDKYKGFPKIPVIAGMLTYFGLNWLFGGSFADIFYDKDELHIISLFLYITSAMISALVAQLVRYDHDTDKVNFYPLVGGIGLFVFAYILNKIFDIGEMVIMLHIINIVFIIYFANYKIMIVRLIKGIALSILFIFIQSAIILLIEYVLDDRIRTHGVYVHMFYTCLFIFNLFYFIIYEWVKTNSKIKWKFTAICCVLFAIGSIEVYRWDVFPPIQIALPIILITTILIREYVIERFFSFLYKKIRNKSSLHNLPRQQIK